MQSSSTPKMRHSYLLSWVVVSVLFSRCNGFAASTVSPTLQKVDPADTSTAPSVAANNDYESAFVPDDDETCLVDGSEEASVDHLMKESAVSRALEISGIVVSKMVLPLTSSLLAHGVADSWNDFWRQTSTDNKSNAQHVTEALEDLGPVYVKFGQALGSRPDAIPPSLANSLLKLQDCMRPFDSTAAQEIVTRELLETKKLSQQDATELLESLSEAPIAAASVGQVYKATLASKGTVAVKIQRPGIRAVMERDAALLRTLATWIESIPAPSFMKNASGSDRLIASELQSAVEGFFERIVQELDYTNEMQNAVKFASLYSNRGGTSDKAHVVVPEFYPELCTDNVLVMEWLEGDKLTDVDQDKDDQDAIEENLAVIKQAIDCTLSQLLDTGVLHADPHGGNLLKIHTTNGQPQLGYLDFGLLSSVPQQVRDALVCAVAHLVFDHDSEAVAMLFGELELVPNEVIDDPEELEALTQALNETMHAVLVYPEYIPGEIQFPELEFDKLIAELAKLVPRFKFRLPPYFLQKARAISYLEGMARGLDSNFNVLQMLYPYALNRLMVNPTKSPILDETLQNLLRSPETGKVEMDKILRILEDSSHMTGYRKNRVIRDVLRTPGGRRLARKIVREQVGEVPGRVVLRSRRFLRRQRQD